jgi:hypothetical protein
MKLLALVVMIFIRESDSEWNLVWNEEFDSEFPDLKK